jgi:hypothetical protein
MTLELWIQIGNLVILTATGIVVWVYTRAAQRSNEIQEEPSLASAPAYGLPALNPPAMGDF